MNQEAFDVMIKSEIDFQLPIEFTFIEVMDFFFKTHKVFNLPYNTKVKAFMYFFEYYVYQQPTARVHVSQKYQSIGQDIMQLRADAA